VSRRLRRCVIPGRFQPFHSGHGAVLRHAAELFEGLVVAISNAHVSHTATDPFTGGERYEMIAAFCAAELPGVDVAIIPIGVSDEPTSWVASIVSLSPRFDAVYTRSPWTASLFAFFGIGNAPSLLEGHLVSASDVREALAGDAGWRTMVPAAVATVLDEIGGAERVRDLHTGRNARLGQQ